MQGHEKGPRDADERNTKNEVDIEPIDVFVPIGNGYWLVTDMTPSRRKQRLGRHFGGAVAVVEAVRTNDELDALNLRRLHDLSCHKQRGRGSRCI